MKVQNKILITRVTEIGIVSVYIIEQHQSKYNNRTTLISKSD